MTVPPTVAAGYPPIPDIACTHQGKAHRVPADARPMRCVHRTKSRRGLTTELRLGWNKVRSHVAAFTCQRQHQNQASVFFLQVHVPVAAFSLPEARDKRLKLSEWKEYDFLWAPTLKGEPSGITVFEEFVL